MGIRFLCPNGHRLNVKSHLAGMRGICPDCDARFIIPAENGSVVQTAAPVASEPSAPLQPEGNAAPAAEPPLAPAATMEPVPPPVSSATALPDLWYMNADGQQFGPANTETFASWVAAGRVPPDSLVWRTGWEEWKSGSAATAGLNLPPSPPPEQLATPEPVIESQPSQGSMDAYYSRKRKRRDRAKVLTMSLAGLVFLLLVVLIVVLTR